MSTQEAKSDRQAKWEREQKRERNALTIMPLPVKFWVAWYDLLPKVLPLVSRSREETKFYIPEDKVEAFLSMWNDRLMRRDEEYVWLHLGGIECFETIPSFARGVEARIRGRDEEVKAAGGLFALVARWRAGVEELKDLMDKDILEERIKIVTSLEPLMSTLAFAGSWGHAHARALENMIQVRPAIQEWIAKFGSQWDLDLPFGGKIADCDDLLNYRT